MKLFVLGLVLLTAAACGDGSGGAVGGMHGDGSHGMSTQAFGSPGDPSEADMTVEVEAMDSLKFDPQELEVEAGDTVTFEVTNGGTTDHEFVLGDSSYQQGHGGAMGMAHDGNGVFLEPGTTDTVTWTFSEPGDVLYACHVNEHFEAGMFGRVKVQ